VYVVVCYVVVVVQGSELLLSPFSVSSNSFTFSGFWSTPFLLGMAGLSPLGFCLVGALAIAEKIYIDRILEEGPFSLLSSVEDEEQGGGSSVRDEEQGEGKQVVAVKRQPVGCLLCFFCTMTFLFGAVVAFFLFMNSMMLGLAGC
jgi:hypothetical protein